MKIPRYEGVGSSKLDTGRSLTSGTSASNALAQIGASTINTVLQYGASQNALNAKLRRLEIQTNIENGSSGIYNDTQIFLDNTKTSEFWNSPDKWIDDYNKMIPKWTKKYKETMDEQTWKEFEPHFNKKIFEQATNLRELVYNQKVNNGVMALDKATTTYNTELANATDAKQIATLHTTYTQLTLKRFDQILGGGEEFTKASNDAYNNANAALILLKAKEINGITTDPDGRTVTNHKAVLQNLKNPNYKIVGLNGEEIGVNHPIRKALIESEGTLFSNQDANWTKIRDENSYNDNLSFNKELVAFLNGNTEGMDTFLGRLENNKNLEPSQISALRTAFKTTQDAIKNGTSSWDTVAGQNTKSILTFLVNSGVIDTKAEMQVINNAQLNGLLKPEDATTLLENSKKYTKERNKIKLGMTNNAIRMVAKELNIDTSFLDKFKNMMAGPEAPQGDEAFGVLMGLAQASNNPKEAYEAMLNINQLLAEGEAKGFSWKEMLMDKGGPNYILDDIIAVHKENINAKSLTKWTEGLDTDQENAAVQILGGSYVITDAYFDGKQATKQKIEMPQRKDGETIGAYVERIGSIIPKKTDHYLPSWVSNDMSVGDLEVSGLFIKGIE
mgnify:FL=1